MTDPKTGGSGWVVRTMDEVPSKAMEKAPQASKQVVLGEAEGVPSFVLRRFTIEAGARVPAHRHDDLEHEQVILSGEMTLIFEDGERTVRAGDAVFIAPGVAHAYENRGKVPVQFICVVPRGEHKTAWLEG